MAMSPKSRCDRELISSLMDEVVPPSRLDAVLDDMQTAEARDCWHLYHLIGDVLRAPDLAACGQDTGLAERLTRQLRAEVSQELPPRLEQPAQTGFVLDARQPAANDAVFRWKLVAGLSSFATVAALAWGLWLGQGNAPDAGPQLARQTGGPEPAVVVQLQHASPSAPAAEPARAPGFDPHAAGVVAAQSTHMLRDPELDQLLAAHGQAAGVSALSAGFLRNATFEGAGR